MIEINKNDYLIEHLKYNIQICPFCDSNNVIYKKEINKLMNLWKCKNCKKEFKLPNKYHLYKDFEFRS